MRPVRTFITAGNWTLTAQKTEGGARITATQHMGSSWQEYHFHWNLEARKYLTAGDFLCFKQTVGADFQHVNTSEVHESLVQILWAD